MIDNILHRPVTRSGSFRYSTNINISPKQHPLDIKYPHKCFGCGTPLSWYELLTANLPHLFRAIFTKKNYEKYKRLKKLWRSNFIQFYCCDCFDKVEARCSSER